MQRIVDRRQLSFALDQHARRPEIATPTSYWGPSRQLKIIFQTDRP
jgi:hypothetical protein